MIILKKSKSVRNTDSKTDLSICVNNYMVACEYRKLKHEKVWVDTTLRDRNLWTSQGSMGWKEIYENQWNKSL
jgi:hypothetical protein